MGLYSRHVAGNYRLRGRKLNASNTPPAVALPPKVRRIRRWNDRAYKKFVDACAEDLGISINALYKRAGVDPSSHSTDATKNGRSIEQILAVADAAEKDPALLIAAGTLGQPNKVKDDADVAKLAVMSTLASHLYAALSPAQPSLDDVPKLLHAVLAAIKTKD